METHFKYIRIIQRLEDDAAGTIRTHYSQELNVVDAALDQILDGLGDFGSLKGKPDSRLESARLFLATRSFNSLWTARLVLERGYFQQAMTMIRMAMEDQLVADDIENHPPTLDALLGGEESIGSFASMADRLGPQGRAVWDAYYGMVSEYAAHTRTMSLRSLNTIGSDGRQLLRPGGNYDEVYVVAALSLLSREIVTVMKTVAQLTTPLGSDWVNRAMPVFQANDSLWKVLDGKTAAQLEVSDESPEG